MSKKCELTGKIPMKGHNVSHANNKTCLLYTSDAADDSLRVDLGGRRIIKKTNSLVHRGE